MPMTAKEQSWQARRRYIDRSLSSIPTLDDIREATASITRDTIRQILNGQAVYYGYEVDPNFDNEIPAVNHELTAISYERAAENQRIKRLKKSLDEQINDLFGGTLTAEQLAEKKKALEL